MSVSVEVDTRSDNDMNKTLNWGKPVWTSVFQFEVSCLNDALIYLCNFEV